MTPREEGFLLLSSTLGDPSRKPLTTAQLRLLARRMAASEMPRENRELALSDLTAVGCSAALGEHILCLLAEKERLCRYLNRGERVQCVPLTRVTDGYPLRLRRKLGDDSPGVLWARGELRLLEQRCIALVGSRDILEPNRAFAAEVGRQAAIQGYVLISGNARGSDKIAQEACLNAGGQVISVVADELERHPVRENILYVSEDGFDLPFSSLRALSRNRVIHALGEKTMVSQCSLGTGGTWSGTVHNLRGDWSPVFCFRDGSEAVLQLEMMGAQLIGLEQLRCFEQLSENTLRLF